MEQNTSILQQFLEFFQTTNKSNFFVRVGSIFVLIVSVFLYNQQEALVTVWKESRYENVLEKIQVKRESEYPIVAKEQAQIAFQVTKPDIVLIYEYIPLGKNNFAKLIEYEGILPEGITHENLKSIPINKNSKEYVEHLIGRNFLGSNMERALIIKIDYHDLIKKVYSCPIFNLDNIYTGSVVFLWYKESNFSKDTNEDILETQCLQSSRILGRAK